ncbi:uncharacterized protein LOC122404151 [Colletes gigas]|uniref:uncharacterized protein LOC122404151 n=1 Tax=Colletes gigas TaxID=935657 RepID=UPI001C9B1571|nr:uncharacterized protein LOC122404151 [Colletes gigas]
MAVSQQSIEIDLDDEIEDLVDLCGQLKRLGVNLKKLGRAKYSERLLEEKHEHAKETWREIRTKYASVRKQIPAAERPSHDLFKLNYMRHAEDDFQDFQDFVLTELGRLSAESKPAMSEVQCSIPIELPKQRLPKFGGDPQEWEHFEDLFTSGVVRNAGLSDVQRLHYLNACLEGPALASIASIEIVGRNFSVAWTRLKNTFGLPRIVTGKLLDKLLFLKPIDTGDLASMQQITVGCTQALAALDKKGTPEQQRDWLLAHWAKQKFSPALELEWQKTLNLSTEYPTFEDVRKFIEMHSRALLSMDEKRRAVALASVTKPSARSHSATRESRSASRHVRSHNVVVDNVRAEKPREMCHDNRHSGATSMKLCGFCNGPHKLTQCQNFVRLTAKMRSHYVRNHGWCVQCLGTTHIGTKCRSPTACTKCSGRHHPLLHFEIFRESQSQPLPVNEYGEREETSSRAPPRRPAKSRPHTKTSSSTNTTKATTSHCTTFGTGVPRPVLLATARVRVYGKYGATRIARALLDQGSETSFISASLVNDLQLVRRKTPATVTGLGGDRTTTIKYSVGMCLSAKKGRTPTCTVDAYVVPRITTYAPTSLKPLGYEAFRDLPLADPDHNADQNIEILIGADLYAQIMRPGFRRITAEGPIAQETAFGWVISGPIPAVGKTQNPVRTLHCTVLESLDNAIRKFWETEEIPATSVRTKSEEDCEAFFRKTVVRDETGRFLVRLPFNCPRPEEALGNSFHIALSALTRLRKKLDTNPVLGKEYSEFLTEYEWQGHMTRIEPIDRSRLYIPHRAVIRTDSTTTKLRVVFNATSRTTGGRSLNDILHVGPKLQNDITSVLTRWRLYEYVLVADIEKMFRQILVAPQDRRFQCIVWCAPETEQLKAFELNTVTYGTACAPYLSMRTLLELKEQDGKKFPLAAPILEKDIYVDDVFMGAPDKPLLEKIRKQVCELLQGGGFQLRKWAGNSPQLLQNIPHSAHSHAVDLTLFEDSELKVLGLRWIPSGDYFYFNLQRFQPSATPMTKRNLFSEIAKLFDPLGWLSPVVIRAKVLMQSQWLEKIQWDDQISANTQRTWNAFCADWSSLKKLKIPRWIRYGADTVSVELHGFCDASLAAYSAVTYLRVTTTNNDVFTTLMMAKTRVAPIKTQSIPVLELNGAVLLSELVVHVKRSLSLKVDRIICWTDSTIALAWLRKHASTWKVVVANRVSKIQTMLPNAEWYHVPTRSNPADLNSRGVEAAELLQSELWISGPSWLRQAEESWPKMPASLETEEGKRVSHTLVATPEKEWEFVFRFSKWNKLLRVTAYCLRLRRARDGKRRSYDAKVVEASEMRRATERIARYLQRTHFADEYQCLKKHRIIPAKSPLKSLNPFLDDRDVLRVGGRLENAALTWETKHPIILPKHHVSNMIIRQCHVDTLHGGLQLTMYTVRQKFWIIGGRNAARTVIQKCMRCVRWNATTSTQLMQDLIPERSRAARPFSNCGVDYAGPYRVRDSAGRGKTAHKAYIAVFICFATKAVHVELVHDYTTSAFLAALDRFIARRGVPSCMFSDNGTNFVGADRELREHFNIVYNTHEMRSTCSQKGIKWKFNPPSAPHFSGMQEAGVKSVKHHLKRIIGDFTPTSEEMQTLLCKIEASLNSRPIAALSDCPEDYAPLTPGHFLIGCPINALPVESVENENLSRLTRWRAIQKFHEQLWRHWTRDYLMHLQNRYKWRNAQLQLKPNDLVLVQNPLLPPNQWEIGRIEEIFPGKDRLVRVVKVRTATSTYTRPITRLCKLPVEESTQTKTTLSGQKKSRITG